MMREILDALDRWERGGERTALATLVAVRGSAPRLPGARLCANERGEMVGSVSAGCVENELLTRAREVLASGRAEVVTYGIASELGFEVGLSCGGRIDVLVEPFRADDTWRALGAAVAEQSAAAFVVAVDPEPLRGRRLVVVRENREGPVRVVGSIDAEIDTEIEHAAVAALDGHASPACVSLSRRAGEVRAFIEPFLPPPRLIVVGATHVAVVLCRLASEVGYSVTVVDPRDVFASPERFPDAAEIVTDWPERVFADLKLDESCYVVTLTHDPKFDLPTLRAVLRSDVRYIGAMASRRTHAKRRAQLESEGFDDAELARIHSPVGLNIGGRGPEEIAVSVLAEMLAVRHGRGAEQLWPGRDSVVEDGAAGREGGDD